MVKPIALLLSACVSGLLGCSGMVPAPPSYWKSQVLDSAPHFEGNQSKLQVIVTYDPIYSTHTALRLASAGDGALFWDPAGRYAETSNGHYQTHVKRVNDLIVENAPTIETYWMSSVNASDTAMEVFEWNLRDEQTQRIRHALLQGAGLEATHKDFRTETTKPFCTLAVSEFLSSFGGDPVTLEGTYFLPHSLAEALYRAHPGRVLVFQRGRKITVYTNHGSS